MEKESPFSLDVSDDEIRENFKLLTQRSISPRTISVGKCIAKVAQKHVAELLKPGVLSQRTGDYYLIKAELLDQLFRKLDLHGNEPNNTN